MHTFEMKPRDVLFMRDARPMEASDAGLGANWPRPEQLYQSIHHAFLRQWIFVQEWESADGHTHTFRNKAEALHKDTSKDKNVHSSLRFGALKTFGPFPKRSDVVYLPCPLDLGMRVSECDYTDLPKPLTHGFLSNTQEKVLLPQWISVALFNRYLSGETVTKSELESEMRNPLYDAERTIGIGIDASTGTTEDGAFYQAEYLRLRDDVSLAFEAQCDVKQRKGERVTDVFVRPDCPKEALFGGQQGMVAFKRVEGECSLLSQLKSPEIKSVYLRWTLLTPALFVKGWMPDWLSDDGKVMLPRVRVEREAGESRATWKARQNMKTGFEATLIAARIGKPIHFSGWNLTTGSPKPTQLAVPVGSSYVFECGSIDEAKALATVLNHPNPHSQLGEKGYGIGICSTIEV